MGTGQSNCFNDVIKDRQYQYQRIKLEKDLNLWENPIIQELYCIMSGFQLLRALSIMLVLLCVLVVNSAWAQNLPPIDVGEKKYPNMDSRLASMYEDALAADDSDLFNSVVPQGSGGERVQVILEMVTADAPLPENLGIIIETSYENLIQATVPVRNLVAIASAENVLRVSLPSTPVPAVVPPPADVVPAMVQPLAEDKFLDGIDTMYILIPAIILPAVAITFWKIKSRK